MGGERRENPGSRRSFSIFNTFSFHPTPEPGFRWPSTLHGRGRAAAANAAPPAAAGGLAASPRGPRRWRGRLGRSPDSGRLGWAPPRGERALPETVLRCCSLASVPLSVLSCLPGWISYLQPGGLFLVLILRCLACPRAGIDRSLV